MKKSTRKCSKRLLAMLMVVALIFFNAEVALATEMDSKTDEGNSNIMVIADQFSGVVPDVSAPTSYTEVYERLIAWQDILPDGTPWDDYSPYGDKGNLGKGYTWKGGLIDGKRMISVGCAAFACILSDVAFGNLPAKTIHSGNFSFEDIRVGDILRINNNSHSVIVLQTNAAGVIIAEGNNSGKVYWGRALSKKDVMYANFIVTRYPDGFISDDEEEANNIVDQGNEGNFNWTLTKSGVLTISGSGEMPNFSLNDNYLPSWSKTTYPVNSIKIESGITSIGDYTFYESSSMSVDIPNTVTKIGDNAFMNSNLIGVSIPGTVTTIGYQAFRDCRNLASLTLAEGTTTIGDNSFRACDKISGILNIPASVTYVGASAFTSCLELMSVQFASSSHAVTIGDNAFTQCWKMLSIKLPENLTNISNGLFQQCKMLAYLYIPASVQNIELGMVGRDSPFLSSAIMQIDFGGTEEEWKKIGGNTALSNAYLSSVTVNFNIPPTMNPSNPETPDNTATPTTPANTVAPTTPANTVAPTTPANTAAPTTPTNTVAPTTPANTVAPTTPANTVAPTTPANTVAPTTPDSIATPDNNDNTGTGTNTNTGIINTSKIHKSKTTKAYKYAKRVKGRSLYDSKNKRVDKYNLKKGMLKYKGKKIKNVKQAGYRTNGNLVYLLKNGTVKQINRLTFKIRTLYKKNIKKLVKKRGFFTKVKTKSNKIKKIKK